MLKKHLQHAAFLLYVCMLCSCVNHTKSDGYGNISWNTDIKYLADSGLLLADERDGLIFYNVNSGEQVFQKAKPDKTKYGFFDGKFTSVYLELSSRANCNYMKEELIEKYGRPSSGFLDKILKWEGLGTTVLYVERNSGMSCSAKISHAAAAH